MTTTIEITTWPCSEKYAQDPTMVHSAFRELLGPDRLKGLNDAFSGTDIGKQNAWIALNWDSVQDHMDFLADKERQAPFAELFADAQKAPGTNDITMKHFVLPADAALRCLRAQFTEVAWFKAKEGVSLDAVQAAVEKFVAHASEGSAPPIAAVCGLEVPIGNPEKELCLGLVIGWESTEDQKVAEESKEVKALIEEMSGIGEFEAHTAILQEVV